MKKPEPKIWWMLRVRKYCRERCHTYSGVGAGVHWDITHFETFKVQPGTGNIKPLGVIWIRLDLQVGKIETGVSPGKAK